MYKYALENSQGSWQNSISYYLPENIDAEDGEIKLDYTMIEVPANSWDVYNHTTISVVVTTKYKGESMMDARLDRMNSEYKELLIKLDKLEEFICSDTFDFLAPMSQFLLYNQEAAMKIYADTLKLRIDLKY